MMCDVDGTFYIYTGVKGSSRLVPGIYIHDRDLGDCDKLYSYSVLGLN